MRGQLLLVVLAVFHKESLRWLGDESDAGSIHHVPCGKPTKI